MALTKASSGICSVKYLFGAHLQSAMRSVRGRVEKFPGKSICSCNSEKGSFRKEYCSELIGVFSELFGVFFLMNWENFRTDQMTFLRAEVLDQGNSFKLGNRSARKKNRKAESATGLRNCSSLGKRSVGRKNMKIFF